MICFIVLISLDGEIRILAFSFIAKLFLSLPKPTLATIFASVKKTLRHFNILSDQVVNALLRRVGDILLFSSRESV